MLPLLYISCRSEILDSLKKLLQTYSLGPLSSFCVSF